MIAVRYRHLWHTWLAWVKTLYTGYLASVMATGIVSTALLLDHVTVLSQILLGIACVLLLYMAAVYVLRWVLYPGQVRRDATDPTTVFGYFTFVAGVGVVATRFSLGGWTVLPGILTLVAAAAWLFLTYWTFTMLVVTSDRPIDQAVNGSWLIAIVATESLAITWVLLIRVQAQLSAPLQLIAYMYWTFGVLLYLIFIAFIMYRFFFTRVRPTDLSPPYWINMGAMAITTVAGARLFLLPTPDTFLASLKPYVLGFTVMMWAWGTWWIPLLIVFGFWKYAISRQPLRYAPPLWSIVFPLGMYATAVQLLSRIAGLEFLSGIGPASTWIAFGAWALVAAGWAWSAVAGAWRAMSSQRDVAHPLAGQVRPELLSRHSSAAKSRDLDVDTDLGASAHDGMPAGASPDTPEGSARDDTTTSVP